MIKKIKYSLACLPLIIFLSCNKRITCKDLQVNYLAISLKFKDDTTTFIKKLDELLLEQPTCIKAIQLRGTLLFEYENYIEAKNDFWRAIKIDSLNAYSLFHLGMLYNFQGRNDSSLVFLNMAKKLKERKGYIIDINNDFSQELDVKYNDINHFRGIVLFELDEYTRAKSDFLFCLQNNYHGYDTFAYLSVIYLKEKMIDSACFFYKQAIEGGKEYIFDTTLVRLCGNVLR